MSCRYASVTDEYHGWECSVTEGACAFLIPSEKACYEEYEEGPLAFEEETDEQTAEKETV